MSVLASLLGRRVIAWLFITIVASLVLALVELGISIFLQLFLSSLGLLNMDLHTPFNGWKPSPAVLALGLVAIAFVRSTCQFLASQSGVVAMETINARIRRLAIWEMLLHPSRRVVPAAAVNARVGDLAVKSSLACLAAANLLGYLVQALGLAGVMLATGVRETLVAFVGLGAVGLLVLWANRAARRLTASVPAELRVVTEGIERVARNIPLVRILRTENLEHRRLTTAVDNYANRLIAANWIGNLAACMAPFAGVLLILCIVAAGETWFHTPGLTLISFLYLFVRFVGALNNGAVQVSNMGANWPTFKDSLAYASTFTEEDMPAAMAVKEHLVGRATERAKSSGGGAPPVHVRDVSFRYPGATESVLSGVSLEVAGGSQLAIVGPSGCGKSTLLAVVLGVLEPGAGEVTIAGRTPAEFFGDPAVRVGYVGAEAFLVAGTVRENLRYGLSVDATDDDLFAALGRAHLRDTVERLPGGLDYLIAEDGSGLSAGQKQRLCLARAMLNQPHVLVLDEASANLDAATEDEIAESVRGLRGVCTTIVVSHRPRLIRFADQTIALGAGEPPGLPAAASNGTLPQGT
jgi:ABC-type multidrug transport system fused ATPase/permease subunit